MYFNFEDGEETSRLFLVKPRRSKSISSFTLRLTSMIDLFTILLVFLLQSFSAEGEIMSVARDLQLPQSTATTPPRATPMLVVTNEWIILDGRPLVKVSDVLERTGNTVDELSVNLQKTRRFTENLSAVEAKVQFRGDITIQGDKEIPFRLLKKIMFTCGREGFNNMLLAVNQEEQI